MPKRKRVKISRSGNENEAGEDESHFGSFAVKKGAEMRVAKQGRQEKSHDHADDDEGPFANHARPSEEECRAARDSLALLHGEPQRSEASEKVAQSTILDSLVRTILSQNTTDTNSHRTFANLKAKFGEWEDVRNAKPGDVEAAIKLGGLAATKTARIQEILNTVRTDQGECTLEHLRELPDATVKEKLLQFPGVGPKTAACVLMFSMGRFEFPVDTHVWRITKSLGWVPSKANREQTYEHLNARIPDDVKHDLHVLLVEHGKRCPRCAKNNRPRKEAHGPCPLTNLAAAAAEGRKGLSAKAAADDARRVLSGSDSPEDEDVKPEVDSKAEIEPKSEVKEEETVAKPDVKTEGVKEEVKEEDAGAVRVKEEPKEEGGDGVAADEEGKQVEEEPEKGRKSSKRRRS